MAKVRIREALALYDSVAETFRAPSLAEYFDDTDPFVQQHAWAFGTDEELAEAASIPAPTEVVIEQATAAPGEKRNTRQK